MNRIMIGYDGSEQSHDALALGVMLAESTDADVVLATTFPHMLPSADFERYSRALARESDPLFADAVSRLPESAHEVAFERRAIGGVPDAQGLRDMARSEDAELVVVGSTHRGALGRILPGSVGERLLEDAPCPVAIAPRGYADREKLPLRIVGAAFDATEEARRAVRLASELARKGSAALRLFGIVEEIQLGDVVYRSAAEAPDPRFDRAALEEDLDRVIEDLPTEVGAQKVLVEGDPAEVLVSTGRHAVDLMVIGSHRHGRLLRFLLGSVSTEVARAAPWPLVVVPPAARPDLDESRAAEREREHAHE